MDVLKFGLHYWKKHLPFALLTQVFSFTAMAADLLIPLLSEMFIDYVIGAQDPKRGGLFAFMLDGRFGQVHTLQLFGALAVLLLCLLALRMTLVYTKNVANQKLGIGLETDLRIKTYQKLMELDSDTLAGFNSGELLTVTNSDTVLFKELFCRLLPNIADYCFGLVVSLVLLSSISPWLLLFPLSLTPFFVAALIRFRRQARRNYQAIRANNARMNLTVQENIEAVRLVRSFTNEPLEKEKFDKVNGELKESYIEQIRLSSRFEVVFSTIKQLAYIGSILVSAILVMRGTLMVGYLVACSGYVLKIMDYVSQINNSLFQMQQQLVSGAKMMRFLSSDSAIPDGAAFAEKHQAPHIRLCGVSLRMGGQQVLDRIDLDIPYGKKVGIVGGTGSGKSVLLEALVRAHDVTGGAILLDGQDVRSYTLESLRGLYAYVFQDVFLFSNTIRANIAYADPDAEPDRIVTAARRAQAHAFIEALPEGYDTVVGERGLGVSGGQKQRLAIARALLKRAPVLVLDDATSALDVKTERRLLESIKTNYPERTLLISAHRLSSVVDCDEILYLQDGAVVERGSFEELLAQDGRFAEVWRVQQAQSKEIVQI